MNNNWNDLEAIHLNLQEPLMILRARNGILACGYLNIEAFNEFNDVAVIVTGVKNFDKMFDKKPLDHHISKAAKSAPYFITKDMKGDEILRRFNLLKSE